MSTVDRRDPAVIIPPLEVGQRLDRRTFHERYAAMHHRLAWAEHADFVRRLQEANAGPRI